MSATIPAAIDGAISTNDLERVLKEVLIHFGCQAGTVHSLREGELWLSAHSGIPEPVVQIVQRVPIGKGIAGLAAERREPVQLCNLQTDESGQARPGAKMTGMEGSLAVPMLVKGDLRGVLGIAKAEAHDWTAEETDLALLIASRLAECCA
jgi:signal transduction protein with GAF and PtsI domain